MKIDTKMCTPVLKESETCKKNTNPYIPESKNEEEKEDDYGREVTFIPEVIFTPTLTSKRTHPKPYPRLSEDAVEELSESISKMLIFDKKEPKKDENKKKKSRAKDPVSPPLGRYEVEVISKSNAIVRVVRSLRLT
jgi:hypothetical protein